MTRARIGLLALICLIAPCLAQAQGQGVGDTVGSGMGSVGNFSLGASTQQRQPRTLDKIVAVVDDDVILESELDAAIGELMQQRGGQGNPASAPATLRSQVLDQLILRQLQIQRAEKDKVEVAPAELQKGVARIARRNNMDVAQFSQAVNASGMSMSAIQDRVRDEIKISKVRQKEVMGQVTISDADVDRYLANQSLRSRDRAYRFREIRIDLAEDADTTAVGLARERLSQARRAILAGDQSFDEAASALAADGNADTRTSSDFVAGNTLSDAVDTELATLKPGQLSDVFRSDDAMVLLKLDDERGAARAADDEQTIMVTEANMRHIVLQPNEIRNAERTRELARTLRQRIAAGDDFESLAREYSDDSATANQGGLVGWIPLNRLEPNTRRQIADLSPGQTSRVFQSASGYEIVRVEDKRQVDETDNAKRDKVRQQLGRKQAAEEGNLWLRRLRDEAYVDIRMADYQPTPDR
ncbi:hypothetical protein SAJA_05540 [Salinisphaera japonica YTM-1]|uniref:Chaperone SurA n=2 Tax=Salinisphaera TaxID=180541 RepID=A0A423PX24_9GAMM|nr:hypothetical protein SAJA_05540 [Salinisphaera japonica YTM-1]